MTPEEHKELSALYERGEDLSEEQETALRKNTSVVEWCALCERRIASVLEQQKERYAAFLSTATPEQILENLMRAVSISNQLRAECAIALMKVQKRTGDDTGRPD